MAIYRIAGKLAGIKMAKKGGNLILANLNLAIWNCTCDVIIALLACGVRELAEIENEDF